MLQKVQCSQVQKSTDRRRQIAKKLLIELLACQFAFPVRWIETQDELFSREEPITRFIEIGPAKVLARMAKQTADIKYADRDLARSVTRSYLAVKTDQKDIYYEYEPPQDEADIENSGPKDTTVASDSSPEAANQREPIIPSPEPATEVAQVEDAPVLAQDIVSCIVGQKLKKELDGTMRNKSIKELTGGKSTLQNELVGMLEVEFPSMPASPEDLSIASLGESLQQNFRGQLGKESCRIVSRFISSKMPAGFGQNDIKAYLLQTWGLAAGRQDSVLLLAAEKQPSSRLPSIDEAKKFFDTISRNYAANANVPLSKASSSSRRSASKATLVDSKQIEALRNEQNSRLHKHFNILAGHLNIDPSNNAQLKDSEPLIQELKSKLDMWSLEFDEDFERGIQPLFNTKKLRRFDSWWNNVRQDVVSLYHRSKDQDLDLDSASFDRHVLHIMNRKDTFVSKMIDCLLGHGSSNETEDECNTKGLRSIGQRLRAALKDNTSDLPIYKFTCKPMAPQTTISPSGDLQYKEVPRCSQKQATYSDLLRYGSLSESESSAGPFISIRSKPEGSNGWAFDEMKTKALLDSVTQGQTTGITFAGKDVLLTGAGPKSIGSEVLKGLLMGGARVIVTTSRAPSETQPFYQSLYSDFGSRGSELIVLPFNQGSRQDCTALINYIFSKDGLDRNLDAIIPFAAIPERGEIDGLDGKSELAHRLMLINIIRILGDIVQNKTERRMNTRPTQVLLPLSPNHGIFGGDGLYAESKLGLESLLDRYSSESWSSYLQICGAVIGWTRGTELMSDNDIVAQAIESRNALTFSQQEMALNLLALMADSVSCLCESEPIWADLTGGLEDVSGLKSLLVATRAELDRSSSIRKAIVAEDLLEEKVLHGRHGDQYESDEMAPDKQGKSRPATRSTLRVGFPALPDYESDIAPLRHLEGMVDLSTVPVIVGFSELGPWGSSRTRWEMESTSGFSQEGYIEMAWMMNLIKYFDGEKNGKQYAGWVDAKTEDPVRDDQVAEIFGQQIYQHSGIRMVEPELFGGYDPSKKEFQHEIVIEEDLPEFDASRATAESFKLRHGDRVSIRQLGDSEEFKVQLKRGATVMIPKSVPFEGLVAGQIPTGWDPAKYGIPEDIVKQVDPVTAYALCCSAEALYSAGISDASELLQHVHISEIGNFIGSMMGGTTKTRNMYKDRYLDKDVQGDVMQETYLSTTAAWINMLLLGTAGPIKTPTGACATGLESIDNACDSILSGKTKLCFVGGTDDFQEEESYAFRTMNATVNAKEEFAKGRLAKEMSRPTADTRSGFVESQGSGVQIIATAELALKLGLPIYGIVAASTMAADKIGRSVPAPGQGVLSFARETVEAKASPLLSMDYRRSEMQAAIDRITRWRTSALQKTYSVASRQMQSAEDHESPAAQMVKEFGVSTSNLLSTFNASAESQIRDSRRMWGNQFRQQNPEISPLRAGLAVWGLTVDDIDIASLHGTSTKANDKNESDIINKQMCYLDRAVGNPILAICQKSLTGHPKAPAASFMLNGCLQALNTGTVPGNRTADNVDSALSNFEHLTFPTKPIQTKALKAFSLTSFGFGQKGGELIGVHPRYLYGTISKSAYESYIALVTTRTRSADRAFLSALIENRIVVCKPSPQYVLEDQDSVLLDPHSRISKMTAQGDAWRYDPENLHADILDSDTVADASDLSSDRDDSATLYSPTPPDLRINNAKDIVVRTSKILPAVATLDLDESNRVSVGVDAEELLDAIDSDIKSQFVLRNYTDQERDAAASSISPRDTLTGKWTAKEAVFKSLGTRSKGAGAAMNEIEILKNKNGVPIVKLHGGAYKVAKENGIQDFQLSLSHSNNIAIAVALAIRGEGQPSF